MSGCSTCTRMRIQIANLNNELDMLKSKLLSAKLEVALRDKVIQQNGYYDMLLDENGNEILSLPKELETPPEDHNIFGF